MLRINLNAVLGLLCFNEAGARMLRKCVHGLFIEIYSQSASMRPEHGCSGNDLMTPLQVERIRASMRPEHGCSGNDLFTRWERTRY